MSEPFKVYVNKAAFVTNKEEVQISLFIERPMLNTKGEIEIVLEDQGLVTMNYEYAKRFSDTLSETLKTSEKEAEKPIQKRRKKGLTGNEPQ